jgi:hypothetical protein
VSGADLAGVVAELGLEPHPEGGWFRETWRGAAGPDGRSVGTSIYFAVSTASPSRLHRIDAVEVFHWYAGDPVEQLVVAPDGATSVVVYGPDVIAGERPQGIVPRGAWQGLHVPAPGAWALLGCTVAPGFEFAGFELIDAATAAALAAAHPEHVDLIDRLR